MLAMVSAAVAIVTTAPWAREDDTDPAKWKSGALVEYVEVAVAGEERHRKYTLAEGIEVPAAGTSVELVLDNTLREDARAGRDGRPYIHRREQMRVVGFRPVAAAGSGKQSQAVAA